MRYFLTLNLFVFVTLLSFAQTTDRLLNISYGKYAVGLFQQKFRYNDSVEVSITIWQPVKKSSRNEKLSIRDYIAIELPAIFKADSIANDLIHGGNYKMDPDSLTQFLNTKTNTFKNAKGHYFRGEWKFLDSS